MNKTSRIFAVVYVCTWGTQMFDLLVPRHDGQLLRDDLFDIMTLTHVAIKLRLYSLSCNSSLYFYGCLSLSFHLFPSCSFCTKINAHRWLQRTRDRAVDNEPHGLLAEAMLALCGLALSLPQTWPHPLGFTSSWVTQRSAAGVFWTVSLSNRYHFV